MIERTRDLFGHDYLPPIKYVFFNTGLEMKATKDHVKEVAERYGVEIEEVRPEKNLPFALIICAYIIINEAISISENLYLTNPDGFPRWIAERLKVAKMQVESRGDTEDEKDKK